MPVGEMFMLPPEVDPTGPRSPTTPMIYPREIRPVTVDSPLVHGEPGHIPCIDDNSCHPHARNAVWLYRLIEVINRNKVVVFRSHVVGHIDSRIVIIDVVIERFRWEGRPSEIVVILTPRYPGRSPVISRHPDPALLGEQHPTSIVVDSPAERFIGEPCPTLVGMDPATSRIRSPGRIRA